MRNRTLIIGVAVLVVLFGLAAGIVLTHNRTASSPETAAGTTTSAAPAQITMLTVSNERDPDFGPGFTTTGAYPVMSGMAGLDKVNAALLALIKNDQARHRAEFSRLAPPPPGNDPGVYSTTPGGNGEISASSAVVSVLLPETVLPPGGTFGDDWISGTMLVPSARPVSLDGLFAAPATGLTALAGVAKREATVVIPCVQHELPAAQAEFDAGISPTEDNYRDFAVTPDGVVIGFRPGQLADASCDTTRITVPWPALTAYLSPLGKQVMGGVR